MTSLRRRTPQQIMAAAMSEDDLLASVIDKAWSLGWRCAHFRPAWTQKGYRTAVQGDGKGFPDLVLVHPVKCRLIVAELKSQSKQAKLSGEQELWLSWFAQAGVTVYVWRPSDWPDAITEALA